MQNIISNCGTANLISYTLPKNYYSFFLNGVDCSLLVCLYTINLVLYGQCLSDYQKLLYIYLHICHMC